MGEITSLTRNAKSFASLRTTIPISIVRQWKLEPQDKLYWEWEIRGNSFPILGDAAFVLRPHTAAGVSKAATNAVALANSIANSSNADVVEALKGWEPHQIELGNQLKYLGISLGNRLV